MEKVYSKITKTRKKEFQIETAIYKEDNGEKIVEKAPLNSLAEKHIKNIYENACYFNHMEKIRYVPCEKKGKSVYFPFVEGESLYTKILSAAKHKDKDSIVKLLHFYLQILDEIYPETSLMESTGEFIKVFGNISDIVELKSAEKVNIDLTFDNLLQVRDEVIIIDYEWIFDFPIPVKFPIYRAIFAIFAKNRRLMETIITEEEVYAECMISEKECEIFEKMNTAFGVYVDGGKESYNTLLSKYVQPRDEEEREMLDYLQVYWGNDEGFSEERMQSENIQIDKIVRIKIDLKKYENCKSIRIDPSNFPCMVQIIQFYAESNSEIVPLKIENISVAEMEQVGKQWIFWKEDPQFVIPINKEWESICFEYVLKLQDKEVEIIKEVCNEIRAENKLEIAAWQEKFKNSKEVCERQEELLSKSANIIAEYEEIIQLQKDKLAYIESTTAYQKILKKKVESIHLWDKLNQ